MMKTTFSRRVVLIAAAAAGVTALPFLARSRSTLLGYPFSGSAADRSLGLTPPLVCTRATHARIEGPYYTPQTPLRTNLREPDVEDKIIANGLEKPLIFWPFFAWIILPDFDPFMRDIDRIMKTIEAKPYGALGQANGVASLGVSGKAPAANLPTLGC